MKINSILEKLKNTRILATIVIIAIVLSTFFSYVSYNIFGYKYSVSLWHYWEGKVILILAIANLIFIFKDYVEKYIPNLINAGFWQKIANIKNSKASLVPTFLIAALALYLTLNADIKFSYYSLGFYLLWLGIICLIAYPILHKNNTDVQNNG